jgi:thiamine pyrophosphate-dependent acetolactate synthase large subunit-like protein
MRLVSRAFVSLAEDPRRWSCRRISCACASLLTTHARPKLSKPQRVDPGAIAEAVMLLEGANRPMIMVGAGAINAGADLRAIAERLGAPVVSHLQGRGILDSRHPLSIGRAEAFRMGGAADVIVAVGTRFNSPRRRWGLRPGQRVVRASISIQLSLAAARLPMLRSLRMPVWPSGRSRLLSAQKAGKQRPQRRRSPRSKRRSRPSLTEASLRR